MTNETHELPPRRWPWVIVALVAVLAIGIGLGRWASDNAAPSSSSTTEAETTPTPTATGVLEDAWADGCRGGPEATAEALLAAQAAASTETDKGAAEFAATFYRWANNGQDSAEDQERVRASVMAPDASDFVVNGFNEALESIKAGTRVPNALRYSLDGGKYYIESSTPDEVIVSVLVNAFEGDEAAPSKKAGTSFTLTRSTGVWLVKDMSVLRQPDDIARVGTAYIGGC